MECPNGIRICPNGWTDCSLCANYEMCKAGLYYGEPEETDPEVLKKAAEISEEVINTEVTESVESIKSGSASPYADLDRFYSLKPPDLHHKEPMPAGNGIPGGGNKVKSKKSKKGNKPTVYVWGETF